MCKIKDEMREVKQRIINQAANCVMRDLASGVNMNALVSYSGFEYVSPGVKSILCSLNAEQHEITVVNCIFDKGATMAVHDHKSKETVFIVSGSIVEITTGRVFQEGNVAVIPSRTPHGWASPDGCMLTITWRPAYEFEKLKNDTSSDTIA